MCRLDGWEPWYSYGISDYTAPMYAPDYTRATTCSRRLEKPSLTPRIKSL